MLKFKDFPCKGKRDFWTGQVNTAADESALAEANIWMRGKSLTLLNAETVVSGQQQWGLSSRSLRIWYTE